MKCDNIIKEFLLRDDYNTRPLRIHTHILFCGRCRREIGMLTDIFNSFRNTHPLPMNNDMADSIMQKIYENIQPAVQTTSPFSWIAAWIIIMSGIFLLPFNDQFLWLTKYFGINLQIPVIIVMGFTITIYSIVIIATHMKDIKKFESALKNFLKHH